MNPLPLVAVAGSPNAGKSALFNALTGARQKVGNYPGVTVERHSGRLTLADGRPVEMVDLPGAYSLEPASPDEAVTRDVLLGQQKGERQPDALVIVLDASNLDNHLRFALQLIELGHPTLIALNMVDLAKRDGLELDPKALERELGVPVIETVAVRRRGIAELQAALDDMLSAPFCGVSKPVKSDLIHLQRRAREIATAAVVSETPVRRWTHRLDAVLLHPILGPLILAVIMFVMFQAVFAWSEAPKSWIEDGVAWLGAQASAALPPGLLRSMAVDGAIAGVGAVITFLPQILILFFFILLLEGTGYMVRAAFLMDRLMHGVGLSGRAFIPLLSSFACAVPGIMATRTIDDPKDRLTTILVAPLMTCSARLPVYTLIIAAFIPQRTVGWGIGLQGLVMFGLYVAGITGALAAAYVLRRGVLKGGGGGFMMELPKYQWPPLKDVAIGLLTRAEIFLKRAGTIILGTTIILWALASIPQAAPGQKQSEVSIAGHI
ncbi:MAG TPA: ferrous iron transporter B, partial [Sphingomicrobium sp.]